MTTVASGRWTSAPVPFASAIGTKPSDATSGHDDGPEAGHGPVPHGVADRRSEEDGAVPHLHVERRLINGRWRRRSFHYDRTGDGFVEVDGPRRKGE